MTDSKNENDVGAGAGQGSNGRMDRGRAWLTGVGLGALGVAALVAAFTIGTNYSDEPAAVTQANEETKPLPEPEADTGPGRDLFVASCGSCHVLSDADTAGTAGPDLDSMAPDEALVKQAIASGGTGSGMMPPGLLTGADAEAVSKYVASAAGGG